MVIVDIVKVFEGSGGKEYRVILGVEEEYDGLMRTRVRE